MNITHHDSASLNIQAFRGKEHRGLNSTQWGSISSREPTVQWFCSKVYLSMQPAVLHYFCTSLQHWISTALFPQSRLSFPSNECMLVHTSIIFLSHPLPAHGERTSRSPASSESSEICSFLKDLVLNASWLTLSRVGNWLGLGSHELNHHRRLSLQKGDLFSL